LGHKMGIGEDLVLAKMVLDGLPWVIDARITHKRFHCQVVICILLRVMVCPIKEGECK
jgi:hypothetical protein